MPEWLFWLALAAMLAGGWTFRVGLFLDRFAIGSAVAALSTILFGFDLEQQLHTFVFASGASLALGRLARAKRLKGAA